MALTADELASILRILAQRPGHEAVRTNLYILLTLGLGVSGDLIQQEQTLVEVRGRVDALLGRTVFEFKSDLRSELAEAESRLRDYLMAKERETGQRYIGIATDGAEFRPYVLRRDRLVALLPFAVKDDDPTSLMLWLQSSIALEEHLRPEPGTIQRELGRDSPAYQVALTRMGLLWEAVQGNPRAVTLRQLWASFLQRVYGSDVDADELFFQHTYLTIVAKSIALLALGLPLPDADELLSGRPFRDLQVFGAVESDFFDWVLEAHGGGDLVRRIARQVSRFDFSGVDEDVLKVLYESLIDPRQRHDLGEYYTPDWMAQKICERVITDPLQQRVLDPACGSGTFLFHAIRRYLRAADAAGISKRESVVGCVRHIIGVDIHPVAVIVARVTYLLAIGEDRLKEHPPFTIPVYLGDSLQWYTEAFMGEREVRIRTTVGSWLYFPAAVTRDLTLFDEVINRMVAIVESGGSEHAIEGFARQLQQRRLDREVVEELIRTLREMIRLENLHANKIYGYIARNQVRPIWLSQDANKADIIVGNPPWLAFRYMTSPEMQQLFRQECQRLGIWVGGNLANIQDLSAYFFVRCVELYLRPGGTIAFVMPYGALSDEQYSGLRAGEFPRRKGRNGQLPVTSVQFIEAWAFDSHAKPIFNVPSCVLIARKGPPAQLPSHVTYFRGELRRRNAKLEEADQDLLATQEPWPQPAVRQASPYGSKFRNGATIYPRPLFVVRLVESSGKIGGSTEAPLVASARTKLEKPPWKNIPSLRQPIEAMFLCPLYVGRSIAPFRVLGHELAVVPWFPEHGLLSSEEALRLGFVHLANWLARAEDLWRRHGKGMSLLQQLDYHRKLSAQFPIYPLRVVYARSGTFPAAAVLRDGTGLVESALYWAPADSEEEALYLCAILNSDTIRQAVQQHQSQGQWGPRDFAKLFFTAAIPPFNPRDQLHRRLSELGRVAENIAMNVQAKPRYFVIVRKAIRSALQRKGVMAQINAAVQELGVTRGGVVAKEAAGENAKQAGT